MFCGTVGYLCICYSITTFYFCVTYLLIFDLQFFGFICHFVSNYFDIINQFVAFLCMYNLLIIVFARLLETCNHFRVSYLNGTSPAFNGAESQLFDGFLESVYSTFRISLNIVDIPRSSMNPMMIILHFIYIFVLPFMIFNYIIGVVSAELSTMINVREEKAILYRGLTSLFLFSFSNSFLKSFKRHESQLTVCVPLSRASMLDNLEKSLVTESEEEDLESTI